ncbi:CRISPR system precrRNA processing endoribonuclease RAMP protein Cas6 [Kingella negevensis]|uniref:CRISPR-associated protein Cas6 C-terminal domain-containing protein n=1 Tax=Kingella negevensis TaxID=1522312 RepID=A0A238TBC6_9NEIS|nr:CRISPR system precrRNA processing endoribonuclease RAMP protein Cas6 [Kingella negevensis]MDK4681159.1 CRISPR system precrRNA processing endoribonuclease RAMP protein Cas6 [Kingella negevensis]MDK4683362.1 CRISPR system precrRNA processing endoribonuclease RAMP protein Cas6 [Kingella negevensis]MDK4685394.1 CRISPR system precrRNA processing endoribonuclease RAMP protein Cas6 [Kingella negevensis]MDK4691508.1 CRISPR system precrRNA processing endoribonuclease RAMP protein Cas6 [Kingella negev
MFPLPPTLPIARYRFTFRIERELILPPYAGSTLRGVFGHALLAQICLCGQREQHEPDCPYNAIFHAPHNANLDNSQQNTPPQPYIFEPPMDGKTIYSVGENYVFQLVLIGQVRLMLPLIVSALQTAFEQGVGAKKGRGTLQELAVQVGDDWQNILPNQHIITHENTIMLPETFPPQLSAHFHTPLYLRQNGKVVRADHFQAALLLRQTMRRVSTLAKMYFPQPLNADYAALSELAAHIRSEHALEWYDWQRYSNRQKQAIPLGGLLGECTWYDLPMEFAAFLYMGQWLHTGKETVFGLGGYMLSGSLKKDCVAA